MTDPSKSARSHAAVRLFVPSTPWLVFLLAFAAVWAAPALERYFSFDTFMHLYFGEEMLRLGELLETDTGNWAIGHRYIDHEWIPQLVAGTFHMALGREGLVFLIALLVGATFGLIALWMRQRGVEPTLVVGLLALAFAGIHLFMMARPFLVTWVLAVAWTLLLDRLCRGQLEPKRWALWASLLMLVWVNVHAGFLLGFVLLAIFGAAQLWRFVIATGAARRDAGRLFLWLFGVGELVFFVSGLNRYGFRLHVHMVLYLLNNRLVSQIREWQAPYFHESSLLPLLLLIGFCLAVMIAAQRRPPVTDLLLVIAFLLSALKSQRNLPFFALLAMPAVGVQLQHVLRSGEGLASWPGAAARFLGRLGQRAAAGEARRGGLATAAAAVLAAFLIFGVAKVRPAGLDQNRFPIAAKNFIAEHPELFGGRMFNRYRWGGYLAYELPEHPVFINGLQDHYGEAHYQLYKRVSSVRPQWREILDEQRVDWVIHTAGSSLAMALELHPGWRRVYEDKWAAIFVRPGRAAAAAAAPASVERPNNVLLLVLDTTRADAVGAYGGGPAHTPALDRLAREGTLFANARTTSAWTLPSHASLFTGLYPSRHGAHWEHRFLDPLPTTLAEVLAATHHTAGFSENPHITRSGGFAQGFADFAETWRRRSGTGAATVERVGEWLDRRDPSRPFFLFVNLMACHLPYRPPLAHQRRFVPAGTDEALVNELRALDERAARRAMTGSEPLGEDRLEVLRALYRADVSWADELAGRLVAMLEDAGELDRTLVVVLSDHGENLGDHGLMEHQLSLYETLLRVPMILRLPGVVEAGRVEEAPVQLVDVLPTVLDTLAVPAGAWPEVQGSSLLAGTLPADRPQLAEYMRSEHQRRLFHKADPAFDFDPWDRRLKSLQVGDQKLIVSDRGERELFDLASDPGETKNLAAERPEAVRALERRLAELAAGWTAAPAVAAEPVIDEETRAALESLGYVD